MILNSNGVPLRRRMGFVLEFDREKGGPTDLLVSACGFQVQIENDGEAPEDAVPGEKA